MIESINDVLTMIEEAKDDKRVIVNLSLKGDDLTGLLYELKEHCGYEPKITYQAGKITFISVELDKTIFIIRTQQLVPDSLDGECSVSSEAVYNNLNKAMT